MSSSRTLFGCQWSCARSTAPSTLQNYSEDVDGAVDRAHDHWQPNKVLEELITYDPMADAGLR